MIQIDWLKGKALQCNYISTEYGWANAKWNPFFNTCIYTFSGASATSSKFIIAHAVVEIRTSSLLAPMRTCSAVTGPFRITRILVVHRDSLTHTLTSYVNRYLNQIRPIGQNLVGQFAKIWYNLLAARSCLVDESNFYNTLLAANCSPIKKSKNAHAENLSTILLKSA